MKLNFSTKPVGKKVAILISLILMYNAPVNVILKPPPLPPKRPSGF